MSEYTPRNPDAYYGHPLGVDLMKGAAYAPYFDSAGRFLVGRIVEEVIDSKWLAQHDAEVERAAAEKALKTVVEALRADDDGGRRGVKEHSKSSASAVAHRRATDRVRDELEMYRRGDA